MNNAELFATAALEKYRYPFKGSITTEDLFDLTTGQLDSIFKELNVQKKTTEEESLLGTKSKEDQALQNKIELVKTIFAYKVEQAEAKKAKLVNAEKKRRIMDLIAQKQDEALAGQSIEDLKKMLEELD